jgi:hypothetical protein
MKAGGRMGMTHMHPRMDMKGRAFGLSFSRKNVTVEVADQQAGRGDFIECVTERVDQKERRIARHQRGEVIANPLVKAESRSHAKARGKIGARLPYGWGIQIVSREA